MIRVAQVRKGSIGADLDIQVGSSLLRLNGEELRDALDLQYLEAAELVELEAELPGGRHVTYEIEKDGSESLGLVPEADLIRRCTNACPLLLRQRESEDRENCGPRSTSRTMTIGSPSCTGIT